MRKLLKINKLREKAWRVFSEYIRRKNANPDGYTECITCGKMVFWKQIHASHFIHGHVKPTFLEESNVHPGCVVCNLYKSGNLIPYYEFMVKTYGQQEIERLKQLSHAVFKPSRDYYDNLISKYQSLLDGMPKV